MTVAEVDDKVALVLGNPTCFEKSELTGYISNRFWPHSNVSVDHVTVTHVLEYLPGPIRISFINELYRVLKPGGKALIYVPYYASVNAIADPYLVWPPISEMSMQYLCDADFRERNNLQYPELIADFHLNWGVSYTPYWQVHSDESRVFGVKHYNNVATQLVYTLTKAGAEDSPEPE